MIAVMENLIMQIDKNETEFNLAMEIEKRRVRKFIKSLPMGAVGSIEKIEKITYLTRWGKIISRKTTVKYTHLRDGSTQRLAIVGNRILFNWDEKGWH